MSTVGEKGWLIRAWLHNTCVTKPPVVLYCTQSINKNGIMVMKEYSQHRMCPPPCLPYLGASSDYTLRTASGTSVQYTQREIPNSQNTSYGAGSTLSIPLLLPLGSLGSCLGAILELAA